MQKHSYSKKKKKKKLRKKRLRKIAITLFGLSSIAFALVGGKTYWLNAKVHATQKALTHITQEKTELKQQVEALDAEIKHLKTESEKLQTVLWRFDPVIIPESMKN